MSEWTQSSYPGGSERYPDTFAQKVQTPYEADPAFHQAQQPYRNPDHPANATSKQYKYLPPNLHDSSYGQPQYHEPPRENQYTQAAQLEQTDPSRPQHQDYNARASLQAQVTSWQRQYTQTPGTCYSRPGCNRFYQMGQKVGGRILKAYRLTADRCDRIGGRSFKAFNKPCMNPKLIRGNFERFKQQLYNFDHDIDGKQEQQYFGGWKVAHPGPGSGYSPSHRTPSFDYTKTEYHFDLDDDVQAIDDADDGTVLYAVGEGEAAAEAEAAEGGADMDLADAFGDEAGAPLAAALEAAPAEHPGHL